MRTLRSRAASRSLSRPAFGLPACCSPLPVASLGFALAAALAAPAPALAQDCKPASSSAVASQDVQTPVPIGTCDGNREMAFKTMGVQSGMMMPGVMGLTGDVMGRLDSGRGTGLGPPSSGPTGLVAIGGGPPAGMMALGAGTGSGAPAGPPGPASPVTVYALGSFLGGTSPDMPSMAGYQYDATAATFGIEYSVNRNLILGLAGNTTMLGSDISTGATLDIGTTQGAAYLSYATRQVFLDVLAGYGTSGLDMMRPDTSLGMAQVVRSSTDADALSAVIRAGYLFDLGKVRVGPIGGLTYVHGHIDGYTERGDPALVYTVAAQSFDVTISSAGLRFLAPFQTGGHLVIPYLNVTWEHHFGDPVQTIGANLVQAPATPISIAFPAFDARDLGKAEAGVTVELTPAASIVVSGASTFANDDARDFRISAGLNYRF
jgi:uncharacterized protein YhjY with autotransporter beta-barrel domain